MRIYHNIPALYAYNALNSTNNALQKSIQTLSTGLRINSAADDAAGLAISEKMRSQINGLAMAMRNAQDGISMLQTAEGALTETHSMLQRMRELSVQAANDTLTQQDREFIQLEIDELKAGIDRIATSTQFNKKRLLDGSSAALWSTNDLSTKAYVRGSLRQTDQFGQKAAFEGNYRIAINATPGQAEVQKTDIFKIKHANVIMNKSVNQQAGAQDIRVDNLPAGNYTVEQGEMSGIGRAALIDASTGVSHIASLGFDVKNFSTESATITVEVIAVDLDKKTVDLQVTDNLGHSKLIDDWDLTEQNIVLWGNTASGIGNNLTGNNTLDAVTVNLSTAGLATLDLEDFKVGEKLTYSVDAGTSVEELSSVSWAQDIALSGTNSGAYSGITVSFERNGETANLDAEFSIKQTATGWEITGLKLAEEGEAYVSVAPTASNTGYFLEKGGSSSAFTASDGTVITIDVSACTTLADDNVATVTVDAFQTNRVQAQIGQDVLDYLKFESDNLTYTASVTLNTIAAGTTSADITFDLWVDNTNYGTLYFNDISAANSAKDFHITHNGLDITYTLDFSEVIKHLTTAGDFTELDQLTAQYKIDPPASGTQTYESAFVPLPQKVTFNAANVAEDGTVYWEVYTRDADSVTFTVTYEENGNTHTGRITLPSSGASVTGTFTGLEMLGEITSSLNRKPEDYIIGDKLTYDVKTPATGTVDAQTILVGYYSGKIGKDGSSVKPADRDIHFEAAAYTQVNASVLMEVTDVSSKSITVRLTSSVLKTDGTVENHVENEVVLTADGNLNTIKQTEKDIGFDFTYQINAAALANFAVGDKAVYNVTANSAVYEDKDGKSDTPPEATGKTNADSMVTVQGTINSDWEYAWEDTYSTSASASYSVTENPLRFAVDSTAVDNKELHFRNFYVNTTNGTVYEGNVILTTNGNFEAPETGKITTLASFEAGYIGQVAKGDVALRDLDKFWNSQGVFMLNDPQTITVAQGDGKSSSVTLYSTDTLDSLRKKLNEAIATGLGQSQYAVRAANYFVTFVEDGKATDNTSESVEGTMVIRSMVAGDAGKLAFSGEEDLINALSLNVVQDAKENSFSVSIYDAHNSTIIASDVRMSGNLLVGVIHPNVDVEFDAMANIEVAWNENTRAFTLTKESKPYETILHLVENGTVFQVGANENEDVSVDIGNMSADALGISRIVVTDRESAGRAATILDAAIRKVSTQRAKIGAYQNSLEHTVTNLTTTSTNLTAAESRIRDADMSQEMLNFTRLQILSQSGTAMLAQANQLPQTVLSLIRG